MMNENKLKSCASSRWILRVILVVVIASFIFVTISKHFENHIKFSGYTEFIENSRSHTTSSPIDNQSTESYVPFSVNELNTTNGFETLAVSQPTKWEKFRFPKRPSSYHHFGLHLPFDKKVYDIMNMTKIDFDPTYKNPCWLGTEKNGPIADGKFHCVPYFYLIGVKKSGTSDLYRRISRHPEFASPGFKESQWLPRRRWADFGPRNNKIGFTGNSRPCINDIRSVKCYISLFDRAAYKISHYRQYVAKKRALITADCTPANMHIHTNWQQLPGNEDLMEPKYTNFHYLNHVSPNAKIIIIIRDPVTRLYSDFWHTARIWGRRSLASPDLFHDHVTRLVHAYTECFSRWSMRRCIYNETIRHDFMREQVYTGDSFTCGFYAFYMKEMRDVFGKERIHPLLTSEYHDNMELTLNEVFNFLDMRELQYKSMKRILREPVKRSPRQKYPEMLNETRGLLYSFYKPYNQQMAVLMNDDRYLFTN